MPHQAADIDLSRLENRSILIVDDNTSIIRDYQMVLRPNPREGEEDELGQLEAFLVGEDVLAANPSRHRNFNLQCALQGKEAYEIVKKHLRKGIRYPLAFIDMRMPPGWDGLETIAALRTLDPEMRFVIVTAFSDHCDQTIREHTGDQRQVRVVRKPFDPKEIYQLAFEIVSEWNALQPEPA